MFVIIGAIVVLGAVFGGFVMEGGPLKLIVQPVEFLIIGGAALGAMVISAPKKLLMKIIARVMASLKGGAVSRDLYLDLLRLMYEIFQVTRKDGLIALESHIEHPDQSKIFTKYPNITRHHHIISFMTDTFRLIVLGGIAPHDIESLMDLDIETHHQEGSQPGMILQKIGDSMPGLGIVITMQAIGGPAEEVGHKVAVALVGTFLGIFLSYGFIQPMATNLDLAAEEESKVFEAIKSGIISLAKGFNPIVSVEFARRSIPNDYRPTFQEMESFVKGVK